MGFFIERNKKTTLRKQWTKNIMMLIIVLFLGFGFFIYTAVNTVGQQMLTLSLNTMGRIASRELVMPLNPWRNLPSKNQQVI